MPYINKASIVRGKVSLATFKAIQDFVRFSSELNFYPEYVHYSYFSILRLDTLFKALARTMIADFVLMLYPAVFNPLRRRNRFDIRNFQRFLIKLLKRRAGTLILYVRDLPVEQTICSYSNTNICRSLLDTLTFQIEEELFNTADKILVFNEDMAKAIQRKYGTSRKKFIFFEIRDLFTNFDPPLTKSWKEVNVVYVASNLGLIRKMQHIFDKLPTNVKMTFVGPNGEWLRKIGKRNILYKGVLLGDKLYSCISEGTFGLLWYPKNLLAYLKFSSTQKFSSYIVAGLPVLVEERATWPAYITRKYRVGITGRSLEEILLKASQIGLREYNEIRKNVLLLGNKIKKGFFIKRALLEAMK